jgi:hypothetical protein
MKHPRAICIAAFMAFAFCQTGPALAYGPYEELGGAIVSMRWCISTYLWARPRPNRT